MTDRFFQTLDYRADIDGIRAIAVMSVVLYHFKIFTFGAWFGGVDVFFVVSGYLVGGHILTQIRSGVFGFRDFYRKRSLRMLASIVCSYFTLHRSRRFDYDARSISILWGRCANLSYWSLKLLVQRSGELLQSTSNARPINSYVEFGG